MNTNVRLACLFLVALLVWFASGLPAKPDFLEAVAPSQSVTTVKVTRFEPSPFRPKLSLRAHSESNRSVKLAARMTGQIGSVLVEEGAEVKKGQVICEIEAEEKFLMLAQSEAVLQEAEIAHSASLKLKTGGFQSELAIARSKAELETAKAQLKKSQMMIDYLKIAAPFDGVIERRSLEVGDYVGPGSICAVLVDFNPIKIIALANESEVKKVRAGATASISLMGQESIDAIISYVAFEADSMTRSFRIEAVLENSLKEIRGGLSAVLTIELEEVIAHLIPSSSVLLDDNGELIVRTVDDNNSVLSFGVSILGETDHGIWVFGLPQIPNVITVGQNYVVDTEKVSPVFLDSDDN